MTLFSLFFVKSKYLCNLCMCRYPQISNFGITIFCENLQVRFATEQLFSCFTRGISYIFIEQLRHTYKIVIICL